MFCANSNLDLIRWPEIMFLQETEKRSFSCHTAYFFTEKLIKSFLPQKSNGFALNILKKNVTWDKTFFFKEFDCRFDISFMSWGFIYCNAEGFAFSNPIYKTSFNEFTFQMHSIISTEVNGFFIFVKSHRIQQGYREDMVWAPGDVKPGMVWKIFF